MPRYSRRPILTTSISVRDFRKFTFTTSKQGRDFVVYHKGLSFVGNATRMYVYVNIYVYMHMWIDMYIYTCVYGKYVPKRRISCIYMFIHVFVYIVRIRYKTHLRHIHCIVLVDAASKKGDTTNSAYISRKIHCCVSQCMHDAIFPTNVGYTFEHKFGITQIRQIFRNIH